MTAKQPVIIIISAMAFCRSLLSNALQALCMCLYRVFMLELKLSEGSFAVIGEGAFFILSLAFLAINPA